MLEVVLEEEVDWLHADSFLFLATSTVRAGLLSFHLHFRHVVVREIALDVAERVAFEELAAMSLLCEVCLKQRLRIDGLL